MLKLMLEYAFERCCLSLLCHAIRKRSNVRFYLRVRVSVNARKSDQESEVTVISKWDPVFTPNDTTIVDRYHENLCILKIVCLERLIHCN